MGTLHILRITPLALAIAALAHTAQAQVAPPANATGYMVEVHTCNKADSGTNSLIQMELDIRDPNWNFRTLGPWTQDHTHKLYGPSSYDDSRYDDHERNKWDRYFFPESTPTAHIEGLGLLSDGKNPYPGWCWDRHYVTRIENGQSIWTWAWEGESPWIYAGWHGFNFTYGGVGRPFPTIDLWIPGGSGTGNGPPTHGSIMATAAYDAPTTATCFDETFRLAATGEQRRAMRAETLTGNGHKRCTYTTLFSGVSPGSHRIDRLSSNGFVLDCKIVSVSAGNQATATIKPNWGCPQ